MRGVNAVFSANGPLFKMMACIAGEVRGALILMDLLLNRRSLAFQLVLRLYLFNLNFLIGKNVFFLGVGSLLFLVATTE